MRRRESAPIYGRLTIEGCPARDGEDLVSAGCVAKASDKVGLWGDNGLVRWAMVV